MLVSPQWPLFECQSLALIGQDESRYNLVPLRSAKFNSDRDIPSKDLGITIPQSLLVRADHVIQ